MSEEIEYQLKISKAILTGLGYKERETAPILQDRFAARVNSAGGILTENYGTMFLKHDDTKVHLVTFGLAAAGGEKYPTVYSVFGEIVDKQLKLEESRSARLVLLEGFSHAMLHEHPLSLLREPALAQRQPTPNSEPPASDTLPDVQAVRKSMLPDVLNRLTEELLKKNASGVPLKECDS